MTCTRRVTDTWTACRCPDCSILKARLNKARRFGLLPSPDNQAAWERVEEWLEDSWTVSAIASAAGLEYGSLKNAIAEHRQTGRRPTFGRRINAAILNAGTPTRGMIGAELSRRKLRALARIGWGLGSLAEQTGVTFSTLGMIRTANKRVRADIANVIADTYDRLHATPGPDAQAIDRAREKGWLAPYAWDDIDAGIRAGYLPPRTGYDHAKVERILSGDWHLHAYPSERREIVRRWLASGRTVKELEALTGWDTGRNNRKGAA